MTKNCGMPLTWSRVAWVIALYVIYWKDVQRSAVILGVCLGVVLVLQLTVTTFINTVMFLLFSFLVVSVFYIIIKVAVDSFYNKEIKNPFSDYLNEKITLPKGEIKVWVEYVVENVDCHLNSLVRLLLFDNLKASLKFGVALALFLCVTNCIITFLTSLFLLVIVLFIVPPLYERFQTQIDAHVDVVLAKGRKLFEKIIPYLGKSKEE